MVLKLHRICCGAEAVRRVVSVAGAAGDGGTMICLGVWWSLAVFALWHVRICIIFIPAEGDKVKPWGKIIIRRSC